MITPKKIVDKMLGNTKENIGYMSEEGKDNTNFKIIGRRRLKFGLQDGTGPNITCDKK